MKQKEKSKNPKTSKRPHYVTQSVSAALARTAKNPMLFTFRDILRSFVVGAVGGALLTSLVFVFAALAKKDKDLVNSKKAKIEKPNGM